MTAKNDKVEQYAQALLAIARANNAIEPITEDLLHLLDFFRDNGAVRQFFASNDVTTPGKQQALTELLGGRIHPLLVQFSLLLASVGDIELLGSIATALPSADKDKHTIGEIHSAVPLSPARITAIEEEVAIQLGHAVRLRPRIMNNILGGILVKVGDTVIDGTLDTQLEAARRRLAADE